MENASGWRRVAWLLVCVCLVAVPDRTVQAQDDDQDEMKVMELIVELEHQLQAVSVADRDGAEQALIALGPAALRHLTSPGDSMTSDFRARLARVRLALEKQQVEWITRSSRVSIQGELTLAQILALITRQTDNSIELSPHAPAELSERKQVVDWQALEFWQALDRVRDWYGLEVDPFRGGRRLHLRSAAAMTGDRNDRDSSVTSISPMVAYSGQMRMEVTRLDSVRNLRNPSANRTVCTVSAMWEPRLTPIAIELPLDSVGWKDEFDRTGTLSGPGKLSCLVEPGISEVEFSIPLPLLDRQVETLHSLTGRLGVVMAGTAESFEFRDIAQLPAGCAVQRADATVIFEGLRKNESLHELSIMLSYSEDNNALESHRAWAFDNEVFLQRANGEKIKPIGMETYQQSNSGLGIRYLFIEIPDDASLIYRSPAAIVKLEIPFEFTNVRLP